MRDIQPVGAKHILAEAHALNSAVKQRDMAHLLIIDDDTDIRAIIKRHLENAGHTVVDAADGKTGLIEFHKTHIDVVITDIFMPGQEGIETIRMLKKLSPALKIIAISGSYTREDGYLSAARALGADHTLAKPFRSKQLVDLVAQCLNSASPGP